MMSVKQEEDIELCNDDDDDDDDDDVDDNDMDNDDDMGNDDGCFLVDIDTDAMKIIGNGSIQEYKFQIISISNNINFKEY